MACHLSAQPMRRLWLVLTPSRDRRHTFLLCLSQIVTNLPDNTQQVLVLEPTLSLSKSTLHCHARRDLRSQPILTHQFDSVTLTQGILHAVGVAVYESERILLKDTCATILRERHVMLSSQVLELTFNEIVQHN